MEEPIRIIMRWLLVPLFLLIVLYIVALMVSFLSVTGGTTAEGVNSPFVQISTQVRSDLAEATFEVWRFVRPLLQLGIILLIIYSFIRALGIDLGVRAKTEELNIQTVLAFLVVGGFAIAALLSPDPASWLKDLALVVVGFYFGSRSGDLYDDGTDRRRLRGGPATSGPSEEPVSARPEDSATPPPSPQAEGPRTLNPGSKGIGEDLRSNVGRIQRGLGPDR
jgi:hypothetical protein